MNVDDGRIMRSWCSCLFVVVLGGVIFRFPNNLDKNRNPLGNVIFSHFHETYTDVL